MAIAILNEDGNSNLNQEDPIIMKASKILKRRQKKREKRNHVSKIKQKLNRIKKKNGKDVFRARPTCIIINLFRVKKQRNHATIV